ncbi:hypothetical protein TDMWS_18750 [Thermodesulfomicrobium sp. WS]|uniref:O-antigen ligase family protein n=1 Tax=Thermodesulfomicrobium sp. WS TaxID=3004129 RepID=UPI00249327ED|nr:O-antigen ligase family protein [Thermodesulfomicrobium sp. WS]BDV01790.1 hypothetical protein TDMWS_18750 [Thermodesulfomicrobium sp. WS]
MTLISCVSLVLTAALALACLFKTGWVGSVAVAAGLVVLWAGAARKLPAGFFRDPVFFGLTCFAAVVLTQIALGRTSPASLGAIGNAAAFWALGKLVALQFPTKLLSGWKVFSLLVLLVVALGWVGVYWGIFPDPALGFANITRTALFLASAILVMLGHALARQQLPAWGPTLILAGLLAATGRRTTMLATLVAALVWVRRPFHAAAVGILAVALATAALLSGQMDRFTHSFELTSPSTYERVAVWFAAMHLFEKHPFLGCGFKTFKTQATPAVEEFRKRHPADHTPERLDDAHNIVLHLAAETGILGLAAMLIAWVVPIRSAWRRRDDPTAALLASLGVLFVLHLQLHVQLFSSNIAALMFTTLGLTMGYLHASTPALYRGLAHPLAPRQ